MKRRVTSESLSRTKLSMNWQGERDVANFELYLLANGPAFGSVFVRLAARIRDGLAAEHHPMLRGMRIADPSFLTRSSNRLWIYRDE